MFILARFKIKLTCFEPKSDFATQVARFFRMLGLLIFAPSQDLVCFFTGSGISQIFARPQDLAHLYRVMTQPCFVLSQGEAPFCINLPCFGTKTVHILDFPSFCNKSVIIRFALSQSSPLTQLISFLLNQELDGFCIESGCNFD